MKKKTAILSVGYWFSAYTLGLLVHPYKTVRTLVRERAYQGLVINPVIFWVGGWLVALVLSRVLLLASIYLDLGLMGKWLVAGLVFLFWWFSWFCLLWQILVGYLWLRFSAILKTE
jgi:hypothetical protein